jgi:signal transduction histidine kinase
LQGNYLRRNIIILAVIALTAVGLAIVSFEFSNHAQKQMLDIASATARSNADIQAHDLSIALANKIEIVSSNLQLMSEMPLIQKQDVESVIPVFMSARASTSDFASSYFWVDAEGKLLWADSFVDEEIRQQYIGADRSYREYYIQPRDTMRPYFTSATESIDTVHRLYIGQPIIGEQDDAFKGVIAASIDIDTIGKVVQNQLVPDYPSSTGLVDKSGVVIYYSGSPEYIGKSVFGPEIQSIVPPEEIDIFNQHIANALEGRAGSADLSLPEATSTIAYRMVTINGSEFAILFVITPHEPAGQAVALIEQQQALNIVIIVAIGAVAFGMALMILMWNRRLSVIIDAKTSELKSANDLLVESNAQLYEANSRLAEANEQLKVHDKLQTEFINVAAHELRTPMQPVLGIVEGLEDRLDKGATEITISRPEIEMLARNANRLLKLTSDILEVSRIEAKALKLKKEPVELDTKIEAVITDVSRLVGKEKDVEIVLEPNNDHNHLVVEADRAKLFEVLSNLIGNAIKFTENGTISVSIEKEDGHARISVRDSGRGIDPEIMPRLFTKFATNSDQGTGLGLFISKNIVEAHGGKIWANNNPDGQGATFTFTLPMEKVEEIKSE